MTLERILHKKLKTFLKESFLGSTVTNDLRPGAIKFLVAKILDGRPFKMKVFTITTEVAIEKVLTWSEQYFFERDWINISEKVLDIQHHGLDLSFEREDENLWVVILPFEGFYQITTVRFKNPDYE